MNDHRNHDEPLGYGVAGKPAVYLILHGTEIQLAVAVAAIRDRYQVLTSHGPLPCEPDFGCHHLQLVVAGRVDPDQAQSTAPGNTPPTGTAHLN
jgi:hypothetical protein